MHTVEIRPVEHNTVLACDVEDSTGQLTALFYGRSNIPGLRPGSKVRLRGQVGIRDGKPVMINPAYELPRGTRRARRSRHRLRRRHRGAAGTGGTNRGDDQRAAPGAAISRQIAQGQPDSRPWGRAGAATRASRTATTHSVTCRAGPCTREQRAGQNATHIGTGTRIRMAGRR